MARHELTAEEIAAEETAKEEITQTELQRERAKLRGQEISYVFMKKHLHDFDQSPESAKKIESYLKSNNLHFNGENLETAFTELRKQGVTFTAAPAAPPVAATVEDELPPVPPYMEHIKTKKDVLKCPQYSEWVRGKHGHLWKARVEEILRRGN
ncbi:MAG TPA: hypothetical protein VN982_01645 [Candidatus Dormibacteraeota bacterium]|nr:hypothetical protein [Candidatus Dormibacteraeota bacterium]